MRMRQTKTVMHLIGTLLLKYLNLSLILMTSLFKIKKVNNLKKKFRKKFKNKFMKKVCLKKFLKKKLFSKNQKFSRLKMGLMSNIKRMLDKNLKLPNSKTFQVMSILKKM